MRKTRRTDAKAFEKCDKLHQNLQKSEIVLACVLKREKRKRELVSNEEEKYEVRLQMKELKREMGLAGKPPKVSILVMTICNHFIL